MAIDFLDCNDATVSYSLLHDDQPVSGRFPIRSGVVAVGSLPDDCAAPTKLRWPHAAPGLDDEAYQALTDQVFVFNNYGQFQGAEPGRPDRTYLHDGLDLMLPNGTPIYAVEAGLVRSIEGAGTNNGSTVSVESDTTPGAGWAYVHIVPEVTAGQQVLAGTRVGTVQFDGLDHLHLSRVELTPGSSDWRFRALRTVNPAGWFALPDDEPPVFRPDIQFFDDATSQPFAPGEPAVVDGDVDIVIGLRDAGQYARGDIGGGAIFGDRLAVAWIEYEIEGQGRRLRQRAFDPHHLEIARTSPSVFSQVPPASVMYFPYLEIEPFFNANRTFGYYILTHGTGNPRPQPQDRSRAWNTAAVGDDGERLFPDGRYRITVHAADAAGNVAELIDEVEVRNDPA